MDNPFKKILHNEELPDVLREKVLNDVAIIKLSIDVADLFVVKYPNAIADLLNGGGSRSSNNFDKEDKKEND